MTLPIDGNRGRLILVRLSAELTTKGRGTRRRFTRKLLENIREALAAVLDQLGLVALHACEHGVSQPCKPGVGRHVQVLREPPHAEPASGLEHCMQSAVMVRVLVCGDHEIDRGVANAQRVQQVAQPGGVGPTVNEHDAPAIRDECGVALTCVEHANHERCSVTRRTASGNADGERSTAG